MDLAELVEEIRRSDSMGFLIDAQNNIRSARLDREANNRFSIQNNLAAKLFIKIDKF